MEEKIKDLEAEIRDLKERIKFKDGLLDYYFDLFKEIIKSSERISDLISNEFIELGK